MLCDCHTWLESLITEVLLHKLVILQFSFNTAEVFLCKVHLLSDCTAGTFTGRIYEPEICSFFFKKTAFIKVFLNNLPVSITNTWLLNVTHLIFQIFIVIVLRDFNALLLKNFIFKLKKLFLGQGVLPSPWLALNSGVDQASLELRPTCFCSQGAGVKDVSSYTWTYF